MAESLTCAHCEKPIKNDYTLITGLGAYHYACLNEAKQGWRDKFKMKDPNQLCFEFVYSHR